MSFEMNCYCESAITMYVLCNYSANGCLSLGGTAVSGDLVLGATMPSPTQ